MILNNNKRKIKDLFTFLPKAKHKAGEGLEEGKYPFYTSSAVVNKFYDEYDYEPNKLIFATGGSASVHYADLKFAVSTDNFILEPNKDVNAKYVYYYLKNNIQILQDGFHGAGLQHLSKDYLSEIAVPILDCNTQDKIVSILDKADEIRQKKKLANDKLDEFLKSTFISMFGDPVRNPYKHKETTIGEICYFVKDGPHKSPKYQENGIPFISVNNIISGKWNFENVKYISKEDHEIFKKRCHAEKGDMLYTKGGTTGFAKYVDIDLDFSNWVHVAVLKYNKNILNGLFFEAMLNTDYCYKQSQQYTRGIANRDLVLGQMKKIKFYLPPVEEQNQFAQIVEKVEVQKQKNELIIEQMNNLFNSLSQKAFKGEL